MPSTYSADMRGPCGWPSRRRRAGKRRNITMLSAITTVIAGPSPRGGSISPLEEHAEFLLALIEQHPDLTLDEVICAMRNCNVSGSRTALWRFFSAPQDHIQKSLARSGAGHADVSHVRRAACANRACLARPNCRSSMRPVTTRWSGCMAVACPANGWWTMCRRPLHGECQKFCVRDFCEGEFPFW